MENTRMELLVEKIYPDAKEPVREHPTDSGADVFAHNFKKKYIMGLAVPKLDLSLMGEGEPDPIPMEVCIEEGNDPNEELTDDVLTLMPLERALIGTGIKATVGKGYEIQVRPRSGMSLKRALTIVNTPGTIDESYTGQIFVILINLSNEPQEVKLEDKIAQLVVCPVEYPKIKVVRALDETVRGGRGFGSSGSS